MSLPSWIELSKPTSQQIKHDIWLIVTTFVGSFVVVWQVQPDKFSKAGVIAASTAGIAAVITIGKSIVTTL